jgi:rRNA maturation endonuclease Nob1
MNVNDPNYETIKISPRRVYECKNCKRIAPRSEVNKKVDKYFCRLCGGEVQDKTNSETGHDFMEILNI